MNAKGRLAKLERHFVGDVILVQLKGGGTATLPAKRLDSVFLAVLHGEDTPETRIALAADSSNEEGRMLQLMQALASSSDRLSAAQRRESSVRR